MHHSSFLISALPTLDSNGSTGSHSNPAASPDEVNSSSSRKRNRPKEVEWERRLFTSSSLSSSSYSASGSSFSSLERRDSESTPTSNAHVDSFDPVSSTRRSARVSAARRHRALNHHGQDNHHGNGGKDHYDSDESGLDVKDVKKGARMQTDQKRNRTALCSVNKRERKRPRTLTETLHTSTTSTTTKSNDIREMTPLPLSHPHTMGIAPPVNKKRISSEARTRTRPRPSLKGAKNTIWDDGSEDKSSTTRGKASRWTPEEDAALFEGVSVFLKSKGLQVYPPSHLPTEKESQRQQPTMATATTVDLDLSRPKELDLGRHQHPLYRSTSSSSLKSSSSSSFTLSPPAGSHQPPLPASFMASTSHIASRDPRNIDSSSSSLWAFNNSNGFVGPSLSLSPSPSTSSICTGSTLTSEINHTLSLVRLENSPFEGDSENEEVKEEEIHREDGEDDATELFNRFVDSSSPSPPLLSQIELGSFSFPAMHLPSGIIAHQETLAAFQFRPPEEVQPQSHHGNSMVDPIQEKVHLIDWAWESPIPSFHSMSPLVGCHGSAVGMTIPLTLSYSKNQLLSAPHFDHQVSNKVPHERLRPLTPGEILAAEGTSNPSFNSNSSQPSHRLFTQEENIAHHIPNMGRRGKAKQRQAIPSMAKDEAAMKKSERENGRDATRLSKTSQDNDSQGDAENDNVDRPLTQESYALAVSRTLSHCPWSSIVQASPRLAGNRTGVQAQARWSEALDPQVLKAPWTEVEDQLLMQRVEQFAKCWIWIADGIPGRTQRQCRTRWVQIQTRLERERVVALTSPATSTIKNEKKVRRRI